MTRYYCDRCGKELYWRGMSGITTNTAIGANIEDLRINCSGHKTYAGGDIWYDLCSECEQKFYQEKNLTFTLN